jgi:type VI secretion system protein ImpH
VDFFQAVRLVRAYARKKLREGHRIGRAHDLWEPVRFRTRASLGFPASDLFHAKRVEEADQLGGAISEMTVNFLGLTGPSGILPRHYSELVIARGQRDAALHDFLDVFSNRFVALFWRAWAKYRLPIRFEEHGLDDDGALPLLALVGLGTKHLRADLSRDDGGGTTDLAIYYSGVLAGRPRGTQAAEHILGELLACTVTVLPLVGAWQRIPETLRSRVGGANSVLGVDLVCGGRSWECAWRVGVIVGPVRYRLFKRLLPGEPLRRLVNRLLRLTLGSTLDVELRINVTSTDIGPLAEPSERAPAQLKERPQLGWNAWLASGVVRQSGGSYVALLRGFDNGGQEQ